jgi:hypothetical protein
MDTLLIEPAYRIAAILLLPAPVSKEETASERLTSRMEPLSRDPAVWLWGDPPGCCKSRIFSNSRALIFMPFLGGTRYFC